MANTNANTNVNPQAEAAKATEAKADRNKSEDFKGEYVNALKGDLVILMIVLKGGEKVKLNKNLRKNARFMKKFENGIKMGLLKKVS